MPAKKNHSLKNWINWIIGIICSLGLLTIFLLLQKYDSEILNLEIKWLVIATIPLILSTLNSNIIKKFKGFGIELETHLHQPLIKMNLLTSDGMEYSKGDEKRSINYLDMLSIEKRSQIKWLSFKQGKRNYYTKEAIDEYLSSLPNLEYFEIIDKEGDFIALIPINNSFDNQENFLSSFLDYIENPRIKDFVDHFGITLTVSENENLINVLPLVRKSKYKLMPVISSKDGALQGIITERMIESKITDYVISSQS